MAESLSGFAFWSIEFDREGNLLKPDSDDVVKGLKDSGVSDVFVFSHGWNNDPIQARSLYERFFSSMGKIVDDRSSKSRSEIAILGVLWPAKMWADETIPSDASIAAGIGGTTAIGDGELVRDLAAIFAEESETKAISEMADLLDDRPRDEGELQRFQDLLRSLQDDGTEHIEEGQAEEVIIEKSPEMVFDLLAVGIDTGNEGAAAGFGDVFDKLWDGAKEALRQLTYLQMKKRAGVVGKEGLGPLIGKLHSELPSLRVHLLGHSFGARLVSFSLAGLSHGDSPVKSLMLIQGAFSHFAFADSLPQDSHRGGALKGMKSRVDGPLLVTHSIHDKAVDRFYPLASLAARDDASAVRDVLYRWGAMGADGAQSVDAAAAPLGPVGSSYQTQTGRFLNLDGDDLIVAGDSPSGAHSDIFHPEIAWAALVGSKVCLL